MPRQDDPGHLGLMLDIFIGLASCNTEMSNLSILKNCILWVPYLGLTPTRDPPGGVQHGSKEFLANVSVCPSINLFPLISETERARRLSGLKFKFWCTLKIFKNFIFFQIETKIVLVHPSSTGSMHTKYF